MKRIVRIGLGALVGATCLGCGMDLDDAVTARAQLDVAHRFDVVERGPSRVVLAATITLDDVAYSQELVLPVRAGAIVAEAPADALIVQLATIELGDQALARDAMPQPVLLRDVRLELDAPVACAAAWADDDELATCAAPARLRFAFAIATDDGAAPIEPIRLGPFTLAAALAHVGPELQLELAGTSAGVDWTWDRVRVQGTLTFEVRGAALADTWRRDPP